MLVLWDGWYLEMKDFVRSDRRRMAFVLSFSKRGYIRSRIYDAIQKSDTAFSHLFVCLMVEVRVAKRSLQPGGADREKSPLDHSLDLALERRIG